MAHTQVHIELVMVWMATFNLLIVVELCRGPLVSYVRKTKAESEGAGLEKHIHALS